MINKIDFAAMNLTSNAGQFLLRENAIEGVFMLTWHSGYTEKLSRHSPETFSTIIGNYVQKLISNWQSGKLLINKELIS